MNDNLGPLGGFGADPGGEPWNLEETQEKILDELKKILSSGKIDNKTLTTISKNVATLAKDSKTVQSMDKQLKDISKTSTKEEKHSAALFKAFTQESKDRRTDSKALRKDITEAQAKANLGGVNKGIGNMMSDMENFGGSLKEVTRLLGIGGIAGALLGIISNQVEAYQSLINVGQTFGGNIMNMSLQAANAGISLKLMTEVITKHGTLVANVGVKAVMDNQKEVRKLTKQYGQFGLTLTQMNEFNAIYMEQQQLQGILESNENNKRAIRTAEYIKDLTELSKITGKRREELAAELKKGAESIDAYGASLEFGSKEQSKAYLQANKKIVMFAARMGELGPEMMKGIHIGIRRGNIAVNKQMLALVSLKGPVGQAARALQMAVSSKNIPEIEKRAEALADSLGTLTFEQKREIEQRARAGHQMEEMTLLLGAVRLAEARRSDEQDRAARMLGMGLDMTTTKLDDATAELLNFESNINTAWGAVRAAFVELLGPVIQQLIVSLANVVGYLNDIIEWISTSTVGKWIAGLSKSFKEAVNETKELKKVLGGLGDVVVTAVGIIGGFLILKKVFSFLGSSKAREAKAANTLTRAMNRASRAANRFARSGGGGGGDGGGDGRRRKTRRLRRRGFGRRRGRGIGRLIGGAAGLIGLGAGVIGLGGGGEVEEAAAVAGGGAAEAVVEKKGAAKAAPAVAKVVATGTAKTTGKTVGKAVLKSALKKIPFFGLFAGLAFAAGRAMDGDFAGAAAEALSGAAGSIPGIGTAASLAIDAGLLARDLAKQKGGATPVATSTIPPLRKPAEEAVAKMTQAETNAATVKLMQEMVDEQRKSRERMEKIQANTQSTAKSTKRSEPDQVTGNTVS